VRMPLFGVMVEEYGIRQSKQSAHIIKERDDGRKLG
jgi:hypothetical protein